MGVKEAEELFLSRPEALVKYIKYLCLAPGLINIDVSNAIFEDVFLCDNA